MMLSKVLSNPLSFFYCSDQRHLDTGKESNFYCHFSLSQTHFKSGWLHSTRKCEVNTFSTLFTGKYVAEWNITWAIHHQEIYSLNKNNGRDITSLHHPLQEGSPRISSENLNVSSIHI